MESWDEMVLPDLLSSNRFIKSLIKRAPRTNSSQVQTTITRISAATGIRYSMPLVVIIRLSLFGIATASPKILNEIRAR